MSHKISIDFVLDKDKRSIEIRLFKRETGRQSKRGSTPLIGAGANETSPKVFCQPSIFNRKVETKKEF